MITKKCIICRKKFKVYPSWNSRKFCSHKCYWKTLEGKHISCKTEYKKGQKSPNYKGGMRSKSGYLWIYKPNHHRAMKSGYVLNSVLVAEKTIGRKLLDTEIAHHIDKNKLNDKPENLKIMDRKEHKCLHATERWENGTFRN